MIDGPYQAKTLRQRIERVETWLAVAYVICFAIAALILTYQLASSGQYLKLGLVAAIAAVLAGLFFAGLKPLYLFILFAIAGVAFAFIL